MGGRIGGLELVSGGRLLAALVVVLTAGCSDRGVEPEANEGLEGPAAVVAVDCDGGGCGDDCGIASPRPGTLSVVAAPGPVSAGPLWAGWHQAAVASAANVNGQTYELQARWNLPGATPAATVVQTIGGISAGWVREGWTYGDDFQDILAADGVRSVDLRFSPPDGSALPPKNGWANVSAAYADAVRWLVATGVVEGRLIGYGNSGGCNMVASALLFQGIPYHGVIFGAGPFPADLRDCPTPGSAQVFGDVPGGCSQAPAGLRACRSFTGPATAKLLPSTDVVVLVGTSDPNGPFIWGEANQVLNMIRARSEYAYRPIAPHAILESTAGLTAMLFEARRMAGVN